MSLIDPIDRNALMVKLGIVNNCEACEFHETIYCSWKPNAVDVCEAICDAPTIEPERKPGHWIIYTVSMLDGEDCKCSECGQTSCAPYWNFCPNCGADMRGEQDK